MPFKEMPVEPILFQRNKTFDPLLRVLHWLLAIAILFLFATELTAEALPKGELRRGVWAGHVFVGYLMAICLGLRILWGFVGPRYSRWRDMWHPAAWLRPAKPREGTFGHDPLASVVFLAFYAICVLMVATGVIVAAGYFDLGPLSGRGITKQDVHILKEAHEVLSCLIAAFVALHLGALIHHERRGPPLAQAMISGWQYLSVETPPERRNRGNACPTSPTPARPCEFY